MSGFTFKQFQTFVDMEGEVSDDQINEIFGLFRNNKKIEKLKAEREKLRGDRAAKNKQIDAALIKFANGTKKGVISDKEIEDALDPNDRKRLSRDDRIRHKEMDEIRKKLGLAEEKVRAKSYGDAERMVIDVHKGAEIGHDKQGWFVVPKEPKDPKKQVQDLRK